MLNVCTYRVTPTLERFNRDESSTIDLTGNESKGDGRPPSNLLLHDANKCTAGHKLPHVEIGVREENNSEKVSQRFAGDKKGNRRISCYRLSSR